MGALAVNCCLINSTVDGATVAVGCMGSTGVINWIKCSAL